MAGAKIFINSEGKIALAKKALRCPNGDRRFPAEIIFQTHVCRFDQQSQSVVVLIGNWSSTQKKYSPYAEAIKIGVGVAKKAFSINREQFLSRWFEELGVAADLSFLENVSFEQAVQIIRELKKRFSL